MIMAVVVVVVRMMMIIILSSCSLRAVSRGAIRDKDIDAIQFLGQLHLFFDDL